MIRPLDPTDDAEIALAAARMRATLVEVLGEARGGAMYTHDWLEGRVREHLAPHAAVFVAEDATGAVVGHTIVREEPAGHGLFSTTYVAPAARRHGHAAALLAAGEGWMCARGLASAATYTDPGNAKLIALYARHGYAQEDRGEFVRLSRPLR